ncbi:MAG: putative transrane protein [Gemmatimonadetes bacterium]|nr:putative transrane protein [Gemmatimonadota bacterium]
MSRPKYERGCSARSRSAILVIIAGTALLVAAAPLAGGVLGALVFATVLDAPYRRLSARIGRERAASLMLAACVLLVFVPALAIGHAFLEQLRNFDFQSPGGTRLRDVIPGDGTRAGEVVAAIESQKDAVREWAARVATSFAGSATHGLLNLIVAFLCLYFALLSGDTLWTRVRGYLPFSPESSDQLGTDLQRVTKATLLGSLLSAALQGTSMSIGFLLVGFHGAAFWGVMGGLASMVPVVGSAIVAVPAALLLLVRHNTGGALIVMAFGWLVPDLIDKVARAMVSRRLGDVHPLTTLLGALIGVPLFGMIGIVVGPLLISLFLALLRAYQRDYGATELTTSNERLHASHTLTGTAP